MTPDANPPGLQELAETLTTAYHDPSHAPRIFSLMGPNGAGKSRLLRLLDTHFHQFDVPRVAIDTTRRNLPGIEDHGELRLNIDLTQSPDISTLRNKTMDSILLSTPIDRRPTLSLNNALSVMISYCRMIDRASIAACKDRLYTYHESGKIGPEPELPERLVPNIERHLSTLLGYEARVCDESGDRRARIEFRHGHIRFEMHELSDGEKQIMLLSILLLARSTRSSFVFLVDEPELYLNESRAAEIWTAVERIFSSTVFLYATHSVSFATRPTIDKTFLLARGTFEEVDRSRPVSSAVLQSIVGTRIQLLRTDMPIIFCEDQMHEMLIADLFDTSFHVQGLGSCSEVELAVRREDAWSQVRSGSAPFCGIVDRNSRTDHEVSRLEENRVFCFPLYESDSILLIPELATIVIAAATGRTVGRERYEEWLVNAARESLHRSINKTASYLERRQQVKLNFEFDGKKVEVKGIDSTTLEQEFSGKATQMIAAVENGDIDDILRLQSGKVLFRGLKPQCPGLYDDPGQAYRSMRQAPAFVDQLRQVPALSEMCGRIRTALAT